MLYERNSILQIIIYLDIVTSINPIVHQLTCLLQITLMQHSTTEGEEGRRSPEQTFLFGDGLVAPRNRGLCNDGALIDQRIKVIGNQKSDNLTKIFFEKGSDSGLPRWIGEWANRVVLVFFPTCDG